MNRFACLYELASLRSSKGRLKQGTKDSSGQVLNKMTDDRDEGSYVPRIQDIDQLIFLVVDDVPASCKLLTLLLKELGARSERVLSAYSVPDAQLCLEKYPIDIVLSDLHFPVQSGIDLLRGMRHCSETWNVPFILVTNSPDHRGVVEARRLGASSVLTKPFSIEAVTQEISKAMTSMNE